MQKKYFTIKETAELLGVTPLTLRNWDKSGKLPARRNPINNYRVYMREDIESLVGKIESGNSKPEKTGLRKLKVQSLDSDSDLS